ncbi:MAG TPA: glycosyltransferase family 4 protein, partial [Candidatus Limnocylindrales bacterium]|nr:glycosyltransferase family 4 protein [Candidatus Limnocylindrales bacterium]
HRFLLSVGRLDRVKRGDFLIRALSSLPEDVALVFAGPDAGCRDEWLRLAQDLGLAKRVKILGEVSDADLKAAYQTCSALVLASRYEGLPTVILEAMALGAPVVASATGGTSWLITPGETGFLFAYDDASAFAAAVQSALAPEVKQIVSKAHEMVAKQYSWEANLPRIAALYAARSAAHAPEAVAAGR